MNYGLQGGESSARFVRPNRQHTEMTAAFAEAGMFEAIGSD